MNADVIPLGKHDASGEVEGKLIGAVLELPDKFDLVESIGLSREDFKNPRAAIAWTIIRKLAERRLDVTAVTVCSAGQRVRLLGDEDLRWLTDIQESNLLTREQVIQVAEDVRMQSRARNIRAQLQQQIDLIDRGRFAPSHASDALTTIVQELATDFARDETADTDLLALNASWDRNVTSGRTGFDPTGIRILDEMIGGHPRNLFLVHGRGGVGKNAYLATVIRAQLRADAHLQPEEQGRTGLFGLESGTKWLTNRWQAEDLGIVLRDVGSKRLTPEQQEAKARIDEEHYALLRRVEIYSGHSASRAELIRRAMRWVFSKKVTRIYVDNLREIRHVDPRQRMEWWQGVAETVRAWRDFAERYEVPVGILVHDTEDDPKPGYEGPPNPKKMMGGQDAGARARLVLGMWSKGSSVRVTVTKANELAAAGMDGPTMEFARNFDAGTFDPHGGRVLNLEAEKASERKEKKERRLEESVEDSARREEIKKKRQATNAPTDDPKPSEPPAQGELLK